MKREIKFRGKRVSNGEWIESMTISQGTIKRKRDNYYFEVCEGKWVGVQKDTVGQFTGLKDKNGVEIFEGDIVMIDEHTANRGKWMQQVTSVSFEQDCFVLRNSRFRAGLFQVIGHIEIIGNIHDTPDLLP